MRRLTFRFGIMFIKVLTYDLHSSDKYNYYFNEACQLHTLEIYLSCCHTVDPDVLVYTLQRLDGNNVNFQLFLLQSLQLV